MFICWHPVAKRGLTVKGSFTVFSLQIAKHVEMTRFALVFGINMFAALLLETILTTIVAEKQGLDLPVVTQVNSYIVSLIMNLRAVFSSVW